jgi:ribosomal protein S18 acetylase RimI-like enzyme
MEFRHAEKRDLQQVLSLFAGAVARMRNAGIDQWDERYPDRETLTADLEKGEMYLLCAGGGPLSAVVLNAEQAPEYAAVGWKFRGSPAAVIHRLCVAADTQGKGVGGKTLLCAEKVLQEEGFRSVRLDAFTKNPIALRLYESNGYLLAGRVTFRKGIFNCYEKRF